MSIAGRRAVCLSPGGLQESGAHRRPCPDGEPKAPRAGPQFSGGMRRVRCCRAPRCKLWAPPLALAAATAEGPTPELEVPGRSLAPGLSSRQHLVLGDAPRIFNIPAGVFGRISWWRSVPPWVLSASNVPSRSDVLWLREADSLGSLVSRSAGTTDLRCPCSPGPWAPLGSFT